MKILFISLKYYDASPVLGLSYEYENFYKNLKKLYTNVDFIALDGQNTSEGININSHLREVYQKYDFIFFFMYKNDFCFSLLKEIKNNSKVKSICWFSDDNWRYEIYSKKYINCFDLIVTTYKSAYLKFQQQGQRNVLLSQWAANPLDNLNKEKNYKFDVSFVGKNYGNRAQYINSLKDKFEITCFGKNWPNSNYFNGDIREIYNYSKINLNFSDSSTGFSFKNLIKVFFEKKTSGKINFNSLNEIIPNLENLIFLKSKQIKARPFEILSSENFLLSEYVEGLDDYFDIGEDLDVFETKQELEEKIKYYLNNIDLIESIAKNGKKKILKYHTYKIRFEEIFTYFDK